MFLVVARVHGRDLRCFARTYEQRIIPFKLNYRVPKPRNYEMELEGRVASRNMIMSTQVQQPCINWNEAARTLRVGLVDAFDPLLR